MTTQQRAYLVRSGQNHIRDDDTYNQTRVLAKLWSNGNKTEETDMLIVYCEAAQMTDMKEILECDKETEDLMNPLCFCGKRKETVPHMVCAACHIEILYGEPDGMN